MKLNTLPTPEQQRFKFILSNIPQNSQKILDIACSEGFLHKFLKQKHGERVIGIDFKSEYNFGHQNYNKPDIYHDLNKYPYPFKENEFDTITAGGIIEHLHNPTAFLQELHRILKPNSTLLLTTPNACGMHHILENPKKSNYTDKHGHIHFFTEVALRRLLSYNNFITQRIAYSYYRKFWPFYILNKRTGANILVKSIKK